MINLVFNLLLVPIVTFGLLTSCGSQQQDAGEYELDSPRVNDISTQYASLVESKDFSGALKLVCAHYKLSCGGITIVEKLEGSDAATSAVTNKIFVDHQAFSFDYGPPAANWLAAMISHEIYHTKQPKTDRVLAFSNLGMSQFPHMLAGLELEAYHRDMQNSWIYELSRSMKAEIKDSIQYYTNIMNGKETYNR